MDYDKDSEGDGNVEMNVSPLVGVKTHKVLFGHICYRSLFKHKPL